jgi:hypothetical protein
MFFGINKIKEMWYGRGGSFQQGEKDDYSRN